MREETHKPICVGQCFHVVYQESMNYAKTIVYREYNCLNVFNANSLVNMLALNAVKPRKFQCMCPEVETVNALGFRG